MRKAQSCGGRNPRKRLGERKPFKRKPCLERRNARRAIAVVINIPLGRLTGKELDK
jgi:hypothetical protein